MSDLEDLIARLERVVSIGEAAVVSDLKTAVSHVPVKLEWPHVVSLLMSGASLVATFWKFL